MRSCVYKRDGDASGAHCGTLSEAEKAELDMMTLEDIKAKWARANLRKIKKTGTPSERTGRSSKYRGVWWCVSLKRNQGACLTLFL